MLTSEAIDEPPEQTLLAIQMVAVFGSRVAGYLGPCPAGNDPGGRSRCPGVYPRDLTVGYR